MKINEGTEPTAAQKEHRALMNHIRVSTIEMSSYQAPKIIEDSRKKYIQYGEDNAYFDCLIDWFNESATNNAVINGMVGQIFGQGLSIQDEEIDSPEVQKLRDLFPLKEQRKVVNDLKLLGNATLYIVKQGGKAVALQHYPTETLRPTPANEKGEVESYLYHPDWKNKKQRDTLKEIKAFGYGSASEDEILWIKPYRSGSFYFAPVDYQGCVAYCQVEKEIANYHINNIKNGFTAGALINFNNGELQADEDQQDAIERKIQRKFTGTSNAGKFVLSFNADKESAATVEPLSMESTHNQYQFVSEESRDKILVGHRVTSPMLLGIKDSTGFGNNADEIKTAYKLFETTVINPFRHLLIDAFREVLEKYATDADIYFIPLSLTPEKEEGEQTPEPPQEEEILDNEDVVEMSAVRPVLSALDESAMLINLIGLGEPENALDEAYELLEVEWSDDEDPDADLEALLNAGDFHFDANDDSSQDSDFFKVRYQYRSTSSDKPSGESRELCKTLYNSGLIYRKEDIKQISSKGGAEAKGESYDVFLHKGGANCQHGWERQIYMKRTKKDGTPWGGKAMNGVKRSKVYQAIKGKAKINKAADKKAYTAPRDTPTKGYKK